LTIAEVVLPGSTAAVGRRDKIPGLAEQQSMRLPFEGIELQCECRQRQFQMGPFFGARVISIIQGRSSIHGKSWIHGKSCMRFDAGIVD